MLRVLDITLAAAIVAAVLALCTTFAAHSSGTTLSHSQQAQFVARASRKVQTNQHLEAVRLLHQVPASSPYAGEAVTLEGQSLWVLHRWHAAEQAWKKALHHQPPAIEALWRLMDLYFVEERFEEARETALQLYPQLSDPHVRIVLLLELLRQEFERLAPGEALLQLEPALTRDHDNFVAARAAGRCLVKLSRSVEGWRLLERAVDQNPQDPENWRAVAESLDAEGRLSQLADFWTRIPDEVRQCPWLLRYRGLAANLAGQKSEAADYLRQAVRQDPYDRKAHYQLSECLRQDGDLEKAQFHLQESKRLETLRTRLADAFVAAMRLNKNPTSRLCQEIAELCRQLGRLKEAECWYSEAERLALSR